MAKTDTRVARSYTFTFESEAEKAAYIVHAATRGRTLAGLIKYLLALDAGKLPPATPGPGGA